MHLTNAAPRTAAQAQTHVRSYNNNSNEKKLQQFNSIVTILNEISRSITSSA
jgi:hypothetical protein